MATPKQPITPHPTQSQVVERILQIMKIRIDRGDNGPWMVLMGDKIGSLLPEPYYREKRSIASIVKEMGENTLRARILRINGIAAIATSVEVPPNSVRLLTIKHIEECDCDCEECGG
jgi:hypothetical protein